ncbi:hypothetical protein ACRYCC_35025 [Actinomadura scrupuli]|uniref:hypothetical protein n=1 Tax=Actinomadura scrupuli TaxID=559629 RepID=UPI003D9755AE
MTDGKDALDALLGKATPAGANVRRDDLERVADSLDGTDADDFIDAVAKVCGLSWDSGGRHVEGWLELHSDRWSLDLDEKVNRVGLLQAAVAALLVRAGLAVTSIGLAAQVLPAVVDLPATVVSVDGEQTVVRLRLVPREIPDHLRDSVHPQDFTDFATALSVAADLERPMVTGRISLVIVHG